MFKQISIQISVNLNGVIALSEFLQQKLREHAFAGTDFHHIIRIGMKAVDDGFSDLVVIQKMLTETLLRSDETLVSVLF